MSITEPRRVLVTGASGFTGQYVCEALVSAGHSIAEPPGRLDLTDLAGLRDLVAEIEFDDVVHLAAISFVGHADPSDFYRINTVGTVHLLEAVQASGRQVGRVILASSANIYGNSPMSPIEESCQPAPVNHYATSKVAMEAMARHWTGRLPIVIARPFNYTGVGQDSQFLVPKIVQHFIRREPVLELGNIDVVRDFSDVRDVAQIYADLLLSPVGTVVNICSGEGRSLRSIIDHCARSTGHSIEISINPAFVRPDEIKELVGSDRKLRMVAKLSARRTLDQTLDWMLGATVA